MKWKDLNATNTFNIHDDDDDDDDDGNNNNNLLPYIANAVTLAAIKLLLIKVLDLINWHCDTEGMFESV